jgi:hypothetical protein
MAKIDTLLRDTEEMLARPMERPHQASAIAMNLFLLSLVHGLAQDPRVMVLRAGFEQALQRAEMTDLLGRQLEYASQLATAGRSLLYEEMHKLLSLCDEIHALRALGFDVDQEFLRRYEGDVRSRFDVQRKQARMVAEDKAEPWNRNLWWYAENLA